jgi:hypothetical protein
LNSSANFTDLGGDFEDFNAVTCKEDGDCCTETAKSSTDYDDLYLSKKNVSDCPNRRRYMEFARCIPMLLLDHLRFAWSHDVTVLKFPGYTSSVSDKLF